MIAEILFPALLASASGPLDEFRLCETCETPKDVKSFIVQAAPSVNGKYFDLVGNPETGAVYSVEYDVVSENSDRVVFKTVERQSKETERQFLDIVNAAKQSKEILREKR